jgi:hypothetical protein
VISLYLFNRLDSDGYKKRTALNKSRQIRLTPLVNNFRTKYLQICDYDFLVEVQKWNDTISRLTRSKSKLQVLSFSQATHCLKLKKLKPFEN